MTVPIAIVGEQTETDDVFYVEVAERWTHTVRVPAKSEAEAIERVKNGEGEWGRFEIDHRLSEEMKVLRRIPRRPS